MLSARDALQSGIHRKARAKVNAVCSVCKLTFETPEGEKPLVEVHKSGKISFFCSTLCKVSKRNKHKFNAVRCEADEIKFGSRAERGYYFKLKQMVKEGEVIFFLRQVPFDLPGSTKYFADFQVFYADGTVSFIDVKGVSTPMFILKKKQVEALYPIEIEIVK